MGAGQAITAGERIENRPHMEQITWRCRFFSAFRCRDRGLCTLPLRDRVPERLMLCGLLGSLPTFTAMPALSADPPLVGVNVTAIVHDDLAAAVSVHVPPVTAKSPAFVPLKLSLKGTKNFDRLVTVAFSVFDFIFDVSVPYASVIGVTVAGIVGPVLSATA